MTRVSGAAGRIREDRLGELIRVRASDGSGSSFPAGNVSALSSGRRRNSTSSIDLSKSILESTGVASSKSLKASGGADSERGDGGEGFAERGNAEMAGRGARTPRGGLEMGSNPGFLNLLTTTPKVSMKGVGRVIVYLGRLPPLPFRPPSSRGDLVVT